MTINFFSHKVNNILKDQKTNKPSTIPFYIGIGLLEINLHFFVFLAGQINIIYRLFSCFPYARLNEKRKVFLPFCLLVVLTFSCKIKFILVPLTFTFSNERRNRLGHFSDCQDLMPAQNARLFTLIHLAVTNKDTNKLIELLYRLTVSFHNIPKNNNTWCLSGILFPKTRWQ